MLRWMSGHIRNELGVTNIGYKMIENRSKWFELVQRNISESGKIDSKFEIR